MSERDALDKPATPQRLGLLFQRGILPPPAWERAHQLAGLRPDGAAWTGFMDRLLLVLGTILLLAGVVFFFAFNWVDLPRMARFGILQTSVVVAALLAFWLGLRTWGGRVSLLAAALLLGVTLAVVGQAYQTGADSWRLFFIWMLLIAGWMLISEWNALYLLWMVLLNTVISLYWWQVIGTDADTVTYILIGVNLAFLLLWDVAERLTEMGFLEERWHLYIFALPVVAYPTFQMLDFIIEFDAPDYATIDYPVLIYVGVLALFSGFYLVFQRDLAMVTLAALSVLVVGVVWIGWNLWNFMDVDNDIFVDPLGYTLLMGLITVGLTAALAFGLRRLQLYWEATL